jgi:hypothetical protein
MGGRKRDSEDFHDALTEVGVRSQVVWSSSRSSAPMGSLLDGEAGAVYCRVKVFHDHGFNTSHPAVRMYLEIGNTFAAARAILSLLRSNCGFRDSTACSRKLCPDLFVVAAGFLGAVDSSTLLGSVLSDTIIVSYAGYPTRKTFTLLAVKVTLDTVRAWKIT